MSDTRDLLANLSAMIRAELARRRMSQRDLAEEVDTNSSTITRIMRGQGMCDVATFTRICQWLRAEPADFADELVTRAYQRGRADQAAEVAAVLEGGCDA